MKQTNESIVRVWVIKFDKWVLIPLMHVEKQFSQRRCDMQHIGNTFGHIVKQALHLRTEQSEHFLSSLRKNPRKNWILSKEGFQL